MYGTVAHLHTKPGALQAMKDMEEHQPKGFVASYVYQLDSDPNEFLLVAVFESKEAYFANAQSPEQDADYQKLRQHLIHDPEWHDGEIVYTSTKKS
jgi:heme-degrading monooxygenase HmoA